jgi:hypothetical protein
MVIMQQDCYPSLQPTVLIDSVPGLRAERAAALPARFRPREAGVAMALGVVAIAAGGGIGLWASNPGSVRGEPESGAKATVSCACEDPASAKRC